MNSYIKKFSLWLNTMALILVSSSPICFAEPKFVANNVESTLDFKKEHVNNSAPSYSNPIPPKLSAADAADLVRKKIGGQVLNVNIQRREAGTVYGVKVLTSGRVKIVFVDGQTGRFLNK